MIAYVVGSGGREDALVEAIAKSPLVSRIIAAPGNPGIEARPMVETVPIDVLDIEGHVRLARDIGVDLVICGPERPLGLGLADRLREHGIRVFGPSAAHAKLELSKAFAKNLMWKERIPTSPYRVFTNRRKAEEYVALIRDWPRVIKADGPADGKGVRIVYTLREALLVICDLMVRRIFGSSGDTIVIEQFVRGREFSLHAIVSGASYQLFPPTEDHKQVGDGDEGPMGGGSGAIFRPPWVTRGLMAFADKNAVGPAVRALTKIKSPHPYAGMLYPGVIYSERDRDIPLATLEFNCRLGDPEAEAYLEATESDVFESCIVAAEGRGILPWRFSNDYVTVVVLMSEGYGYIRHPHTGFPITGIGEAEKDPAVTVYHCGTARKDGELVTAGGRVLAVAARDPTFEGSVMRAYRAVEKISFRGMRYRKDIGLRKAPQLSHRWR